MTGIVIDVATNSSKANKDLEAINRNLAKLVENTRGSSSAIAKTFSRNTFSGVTSSVRDVNNSLANLGANSKKTLNGVNEGAKKATGAFGGLATAVKTTAVAFLAYQSVSGFYKVADSLILIQNKLRLVTKDSRDLAIVQRDLFRISQQTATGFKGTADVYYSLSRALRKTGMDSQELQDITKTIQQTISLSGASAESAKAALIQLSQGMSSGTLRGEELNSVMEQLPRLGEALTSSLKMSAGELRKFAEEGKLTTDLVAKVINENSKAIGDEFSKNVFTAQQGLDKLKASIGLFVGTIADYLGSSQRFYKITSTMSDSVVEALDAMVPAFYVGSQGLRNYIANLDTYGAALLTLRGLYKFDIGLFDIKRMYDEYSTAIDILNKFREARDTVIEKVTGKKREKKDFLGIPTNFNLKINFFGSEEKVKSLSTNVIELGQLLFAMARTLGGLFDKFHFLIPDIRGPVQEITSTWKRFWKTTETIGNVAVVKALRPVQRWVEGVSEYLSLFSIGDTQLERAWVRIFQSDDIVELTENFRSLSSALRSVRFSNWSIIFTDVTVASKGFIESIKSVLMFLNLMDNRFVFINTLRFDRLIGGFRTLGSVLKRIYDDVIYPLIAIPLQKASQSLGGLIDALLDAITDNLTTSVGEELGRKLAERIGDGFNYVFRNISKLSKRFKDAFDSETFSLDIELLFGDMSPMLAKTRDAIVAILSFLKGFIIGAFSSIRETATSYFSDTISTISKEADKLSSTVFNKINDFGNDVKSIFSSVYEDVVGHSTWPDLIDGVVDYTDNLMGAFPALEAFGDGVKKVFERMQKAVASVLGRTNEKFKLDLELPSFDNVRETLEKTVATAVVAGLAYAFGGPIVKIIAADLILGALSSKLADQSLFTGVIQNMAEFVGKGVAVVIEAAIDSAVNTVNLLITTLPRFLDSVITSLGGLGGVVGSIISSVPASGLLYTIVFGSAIYATTVKKGGKFIGTLLDGLVGTISSAMGATSVVGNAGGFLCSLIGINKIPQLLAGIAIVSSAVLDSVSLLESTLVGAPFILTAIMGSDGAGRLIRDAIAGTTALLSGVLGYISKKIMAAKASSSILNAILPNTNKIGIFLNDFFSALSGSFTSKVSKIKGPLSVALGKVFDDIMQMGRNFLANKAAYSAGQISFSDMFLRNTRVSPSAVTGIKQSMAEVLSAIQASFSGSGLQKITTKLRTAFEDTSKAIRKSFSSGFGRKSMDFLGDALLVTITSLGSLKNAFLRTFKAIGNEFTQLRKFISGGFGIAEMYSDLRTKLAALSAAGGATGFIGKMLLGTTGKTAILIFLGALIALFASTANAASSASGAIADLTSKIKQMVRFLATALVAVYALSVAFRTYQAFKLGGLAAASLFLKNWAKDLLAVFITTFNLIKTAVISFIVWFVPVFASALRAAFSISFWTGLYTTISMFFRNMIAAVIRFGVAIRTTIVAIRALAVAIGSVSLLGFAGSVMAAIWTSVKLYGVAKTLIINFGMLGRVLVGIGSIIAALFTTTLGLIVASTVVVGGAIGLWLLGPEGSFLDKLEWAKDKLVSFFSENEALFPRQKELLDILPDRKVGNDELSFSSDIRSIDTEKMTEKDFDMLKRVASVTNDTFDRMEEAYKVQGQLTEEQIKEQKQAQMQLEKIMATSPQLSKRNDIIKSGNELIKTIDKVDLSWSAGMYRIAKAIGNMFADTTMAVYTAVSEVATDTADTTVGFFGKIGQALKLIGVSAKDAVIDASFAIVDAAKIAFSTVAEVISTAASVIWKPFGYVFGKIGDGFEYLFDKIAGGINYLYDGAVSSIKSATTSVATSALDNVPYLREFVNTTYELGSSILKSASDFYTAMDVFGSTERIISDMFSPIIDFIDYLKDVPDSLKAIAFPKQDAERAARSVSADTQLKQLADVRQFLDKSELSQIDRAIQEYSAAQRAFDSAPKPLFVSSTKEVDALAYSLELAKQKFDRLVQGGIDEGKIREAAAVYKSVWEQTIINLKDSVGMSITDDLRLELFFDEHEFRQFGEISKSLSEDIKKLKGTYGWTKEGGLRGSIVSPNQDVISKVNIALNERQLASVKDKAKALSFFDTTIEYYVKLSGIDVAKETIEEFFTTNKEGFDKWTIAVEAYNAALAERNNISLKKAALESAEAFEEALEKVKSLTAALPHLKKAMDEAAPKKNAFDILNDRLTKIGVDNVSVDSFAGAMTKDIYSDLLPAIAKAEIAKEALGKNVETKGVEALIEEMRILKGLTDGIVVKMKQLKPPNVNVADTLGLRPEQVGAAIPGSKRRTTLDKLAEDKDKATKIVTTGLDAEGNKASDAIIAQSSALLLRTDKVVGKMFEEAGETIFERFSDAMSKAGLSLSLEDFTRFNLNDQGIAKKLIGQAAKIRSAMNNAGGIFPSNAKWFSEQQEMLDDITKQMERFKEKGAKSVDEIIQRITDSGYEMNLDKFFIIDPKIISDLIEIADIIKGITDDMADRKLPIGKRLERYNQLVVERAKQKAIERENAPQSARFEAVESAFPELKLTKKEFVNLKDEVRGQLVILANGITDSVENIDKMKPIDAAKATADLENSKVRILMEAKAVLGSSRNMVNTIVAAGEEIGVSIDAASANLLTDEQIRNFAQAFSDLGRLKDYITTDLSEEDRITAQKLMNVTQEKLATALKLATMSEKERPIYLAGVQFADSVTGSFVTGLKDAISGKATLKEAVEAFLDKVTTTVIDTFVDGLTKSFTGEDGFIQTMLRNIGSEIFSQGGKLSELFVKPKTDQQIFSSAVTDFRLAVDSLLFGQQSKAATGSFGQNISYQSGLNNVPNDSKLASTLNLTPTYGQSFAPINPMLPNAAIDKTVNPITSSTDGTTSAVQTQTSILDNTMFSGLKNVTNAQLISGGMVVAGIATAFSALAGGGGKTDKVAAALGIATAVVGLAGAFAPAPAAIPAKAAGGKMTGPGTGTSDSILTWTSNGEFIVNALQTKKHETLLRAINSGTIDGYAMGGMVGSMSSGPLLYPESSSNKHTTINHISITGDISRQTRAEIIKMLPQISNGTKQIAYEQGRR